MDAILDAAESVFGEFGVEAATTNAIAERAGASVGSLYHFFPNKDAIVIALCERYSDAVTATLARERRIDEPWISLDVLFTRMIDTFAAMDEAHPGYMAVRRVTDSGSTGKRADSAQMKGHLVLLIQELIVRRCPGIPDAEARLHASISVVTVHAGLEHLLTVAEAERAPMRAALVSMLVSYFTPIEARYPRPPAP